MLKNDSQWDTRMIGRIFQLVWDELTEHRKDKQLLDSQWAALPIHVFKGQKHWRWKIVVSTVAPHRELHVSLPRLTGSEFIPLARQLHGGDQSQSGQHGGLKVRELAICAQQFIYKLNRWNRNRGEKHDLRSDVAAELVRKKFPTYVSVRILPPPKEDQRDVMQERFDRAVELEAKWRTKLKLAQTKLAKQLKRKKHYAKKLAERQQAAQGEQA